MHDTEVVLATVMRNVIHSGVQKHTSMFAQYLRSRGRPVTVIDPMSAGSVLVKPVFGARYGIAPLNAAAGVWWYVHWHEHYLRSGLRAHLQRASGTRVIYAQDPVSASAALAVRTREPVVMVVHFNTPAEEWPDSRQPPPAGRGPKRSDPYQDLWWRLAGRETLVRGLDGIVYVSRFMKAVMEERWPALRDVPSAVIPNFVDVPEPTDQGTAGDVITVGGLEPRKNQRYLLEILAAAKGRGCRYTLTVVGDGPDRPTLQAHARVLGVGDQVHFLGQQSDARRHMAHHRVYCHTSRMENLPLVLIEAMSAGLPVLAVPVGGVPEIVRPGFDGVLWPSDDADRAARELIGVLETPGLVSRMGAAARERVREEYAADVVGERLERFLLNVTGPRATTDRS